MTITELFEETFVEIHAELQIMQILTVEIRAGEQPDGAVPLRVVAYGPECLLVVVGARQIRAFEVRRGKLRPKESCSRSWTSCPGCRTESI